MIQDEAVLTETMVSINCSYTPYMVSVCISPPKTEEESKQEQIHRNKIQVFLTELTALTHKHGFYLESRTEYDYSGGTYGIIEIEEITESIKTYSYGYDNNGLNFTNWEYGMWEKQVQWNNTIVGNKNDTI